MKILFKASLAALAAAMLSPLAAQAQDTAIQLGEVSEAHTRLHQVMESGVDQDQVLTMSTNVVAQQIIATLPADMTEGNDTMQAELAVALKEPMRAYSTRIAAEYKPRMIAAMASVLTADEADSMADFYSSELGQRALAASSANLSVDAMAADGMDDMKVNAESVERDLMETGVRAFGALSQADRAELMRVTLSNPAFLKMPDLQRAISPVRAEMESSPPTVDEAQAIQQAVVSVVSKYAQ